MLIFSLCHAVQTNGEGRTFRLELVYLPESAKFSSVACFLTGVSSSIFI